jgi:hypothetical protein
VKHNIEGSAKGQSKQSGVACQDPFITISERSSDGLELLHGRFFAKYFMVSEDGREWRYETVVECWLLGTYVVFAQAGGALVLMTIDVWTRVVHQWRWVWRCRTKFTGFW